MKPRRIFSAARLSLPLATALAALFAVSSANAQTTYYWDNTAGAGFGTAGGTWTVPTATQWNTDATGVAAAGASITTGTLDTLNFGTATAGLLAGTITVSGAVDAGDITFGSASGAIVLSSGGTITLAAAQTTTVNNATNTINSILAGAGTSFTKAGTGILVLTAANTYTGATTINAGTLNLGGATGTGSLASTVLNLGGGTLSYTRTGTNAQNFTTTNITAGANSVTTSLGTQTVGVGSLVRTIGGTVNFGITGTITTSNTTTNGILGGWATTNNDNWATKSGSNIIALSTYVAANATAATNLNTNMDAATVTIGGVINTNSIRFSGASVKTLTLAAGDNIIQSGGILVRSDVANNLQTITGGNLLGSASGDLIVHQYNTSNGLTIASNINNNGGATALTKTGGGLLTLSGTNTFTGGIFLNGGTLAATSDANLGAPVASAALITAAQAITVNGNSTLALGSGGVTYNRSILLNSGILAFPGSGNNPTISGAVTGSGGLSINGGNAVSSVTLSSLSNTFTGAVSLGLGTAASSTGPTITVASLADSASSITFNYTQVTATFNYSATAVAPLTLNNRQIVIASASATTSNIISNQNTTYAISIFKDLAASNTVAQTLTLDAVAGPTNLFAGNIGNGTGAGISLSKTGAGTWALSGTNTYTGATTISGGTLRVSTLADAGSNSNLGNFATAGATGILLSGGTLQYTGAGVSVNRGITVSNNSTIDINAASTSLTLGASSMGAFTLNVTSGGTGSSLGLGALTLTGAAVLNPTTANLTVASVTATNLGLTLGGTSSDNTVTGAIATLTGTLTKNTASTWTLSGNNNYTGATNISAGLLRVNGSLNASSAVTVSGGFIGGTGTIGGSLSLTTATTSGGINLANGSVGGTPFTVSGTLASTSAAGLNNFYFDLASGGTTTDQIVASGAFNMTTAGAVVISPNQLGGSGNRITANNYDIITTGSGTALSVANGGNFRLATTKAFGQTFSLANSTSTILRLTTTQVGTDVGNKTLSVAAGSWATAANFSGSLVLPDYKSNVTINSATGTTALDGSTNINSLIYGTSATTATTISAGTASAGTVASMLVIEAGTVNGSTAPNGITLSNASGTHTISANVGLAASQTWTVATGAGLTVSGVISDFGGGYGLTKEGGGTLTLSGVNTFSGPLTIANGTVRADIVAAGLKGTNGLLGAGTTLVMGANGQTGRLSVQTDTGANPTIDKDITLATGGTGEFQFGNVSFPAFNITNTDRPMTLSGNISGSGNFTKLGGSAISLTGNNTFTGTTTINEGPLRLSSATALPGGIGVTGGTSALTINGNSITNTGNVGAVVALTAASGDFRRALGTGADQFQITGGVSGFEAFGSARQVVVGNDAAFELQWGIATFNPSALLLGYNSVTATGALTLQNKIDLSAATRTIQVNTGAVTPTISGDIRTSSGTAGLTKTGGGTLALTGSNTYNGPTTVSAGTLQLGNGGTTGSLNTSGVISVSLGATFSVNQTDTVTQGTDFSAAAISGLGGFTQAGTGTTILNLANTYTGPTTISAGTLQLNTGGSIPGSVINNSVFLVNKTGAVTMGTDFPALIGGSGSFAIGAGTTYTIGTAGLQFNALNTTGGGSFAVSGTTTPTLGGLVGTTGNLSSSFSSGYTSGVTNLTLNTAANNIAGNSFTYGGVINDGATGMHLTKSGAGTQTLTGDNTYTGTTFLNGGTLAIGSGSTVGKISGTTAITFNGGTLQFNRSGTTDLAAIPNGAPITVNASSTFGVTSADAGNANANETVGAVTLNAGQMNFNWTNGGSSGTQMILTSLARSGTASANFNSGAAANSSRWLITGAATTGVGQIIGPWYTAGGNNAGFASTDYAAYNITGGTANALGMQGAGIAGSAETTWAAAGNAYTTSAGGTVTLTGLRTITALRNTGATTVLTLATGGANLETFGLLNGVSTLLTVAPGTGGVLTTPTGGGNLYVNAGAGAITVSAPINNNGGNVTLVKNGSNTLTLTSTTSNFSGGVVLNAGTLSIDDVRSIGGTNNTGGSTAPITVNGSSTISMPSNNLIADFGTGAITIANGATLTVSSASRGDLRFGGAVTGAGGVTATSGSFWAKYTFTSTANTFTGAITDSRSGNDGIANALFSFNSISNNAGDGNIILNGATDSGIDYGSGAIAALVMDHRQLILANNNTVFFNNASSQAVNINTDIGFSGTGARQIRFGITGRSGAGISTINGKLTDNVGGAFSPTFNGGTWVLTNSNTHTGATTLSAGTLALTNANAIQNSALTIAAGTLSLLHNTNNTTFANTGVTISGNSTINVGNNGSGSGNTLNLGGAVNVTAATTATLTVTNANSYVLGLGAVTQSPTTATTLTIANAAPMTMASFTTNSTTGTARLAFTGAGNATITGNITQNGANALGLDRGTAAGTLILQGTSNMTGSVVISNGTIQTAVATNAFGSTSGISIGAAGILALRGDATAAFSNGTTNYPVSLSASLATINVDQASSAAPGTTLTLGTVAMAGAYTLNTTGANGVSLGLGAVTGSTANNKVINNTIASPGGLTLASYAEGNATAQSITFQGTGNTTVTGAITQNAANALALTKSGNGILTLSGTSSYTGITTITAGVVEAANLDIGGNNSSIGRASNAAASLVFGAPTATLRYTGGSNVTIDRGFTLSSGVGGGATIESSGVGTLSFNNAVALNYGTTAQTRILTLGGTNILANTFGKVIANNTGATNATSLVKAGAGKWVLDQTNTYTGTTSVNAGTLEIATGGSTHASSAVTVSNSGSALIVNGTVNGTLVANASTTISGSGTVVGAATVSGNLNPGTSPGELNFSSSLGLANSTVSTMEINGTTLGLNYDNIDVGNALTYDGILTLAIGATFGTSAVFDLFEFGTQTGSFDSMALTGNYTGTLVNDGFGVWSTSTNLGNETWSFSQATGDLTLTVVPEPSTALLTALGVLALLRRRR